jgi:hypothetical protein
MSFVSDGVVYRFDFSIVFLISFVLGLFAQRLKFRPDSIFIYKNYPYITFSAKLFLAGWSLLYMYTVISNGLLDRRQGSEVMAFIYGGLPILDLAIIRGFEIIYYPILFIIIAGLQHDRKMLLKLLLILFLISFLFSGVFESRAKIIILISYYYILYISPNFDWVPISKIYFNLLLFFTGILIFFISSVRLSGFDDIGGYIFVDIFSRLDGLEFSSKLSNEGVAPWWGTFDVNIFSNFLSVLPFLDSARELKVDGLTSSKNYLLQNILGSSQFDVNNSVITDLYYFGGYLFLILGGALYGYYVSRFDASVKSNKLYDSRLSIAFAFSFLLNAFRFELDFFGMIVSISRDFILIYLILFMIKIKKGGRIYCQSPFSVDEFRQANPCLGKGLKG